MKKMIKGISLVLTVVLLCMIGCGLSEASAENLNEQYHIIPAVVEREDCYRKVELTETDLAQSQVAAYESDSEDYPDIDVYLFEKHQNLGDYAQEEARVFSTQALPIDLNGKDAWIYVSTELYDDTWFLVHNILYAANEMLDQEACAYDKTQALTIDGSDLCVHIPVAYRLSDKAVEDYVAQTYVTARETVTANLYDPQTIDTIYVEDVTPSELVKKLARETGLEFEFVTINGRNLIVLYGRLTDDEGGTQYVKTYLFNGETGTSGIRFTYAKEPSGFDNAVMFTFGF